MKKINVILIFLAAFLIRLIAIKQSLWLDEATTARVVSHYSYLDIIAKFSPTDFHPPLYYLFMKFWTGMFGYTEMALRMPSVLFSLGAGYLLYLIGGVWAAALFLFNPLIVYYSQEARMYMMAVFFLTGAFYYFRNLSLKNIPGLIFFNVFLILSFYTFYGSVFFIAAMLLYLLYKKEYRVFIVTFMMFGTYVAVMAPLTLMQLKNSRVALEQVKNWSQVLGKANLKNLFLIPIKFSIGRIDFLPKKLYYAIAGLWTAYVFGSLVPVFKKKNHLHFYLLTAPLILGLLFSVFSPLLQYFRFIYLIIPLSVLLALTGDKRNLFRILQMAGFASFSAVYLLLPQFHREDWKQLASKIGKGVPVYMVSTSSDPLTYYRPGIKVTDLKDIKNATQKSLVVIPYTADIHGIDYKKLLSEKHYRMTKNYSLRGLTYEEWIR